MTIQTSYVTLPDLEDSVKVKFHYTPGTPETGRFGKPEDYDLGSPAEVFFLSATLENGKEITLNKLEVEAVEEYLSENFEPEVYFDEDRE